MAEIRWKQTFVRSFRGPSILPWKSLLVLLCLLYKYSKLHDAVLTRSFSLHNIARAFMASRISFSLSIAFLILFTFLSCEGKHLLFSNKLLPAVAVMDCAATGQYHEAGRSSSAAVKMTGGTQKSPTAIGRGRRMLQKVFLDDSRPTNPGHSPGVGHPTRPWPPILSHSQKTQCWGAGCHLLASLCA